MAPQEQASTKEDVLEYVRSTGIRFIRLWFTDILGQLKSFSINSADLEDAFEGGMGFDGSSITGFNAIEESDMIAMPDASTFRTLPWRPEDDGGGVARMFADVLTPEREPYEGAPRHVLRRAEERARAMGFENFFVGPELEYFLFRDNRGTEVLDEGGYFDLTTLDAGSDVRRETVLALEKLGIGVEYSHHEVGPSQHEIAMRYADALKMADDCMTYRITVKEYAMKYGWHATFMPKPLFGQNGSGMHTHQSLFRGGRKAFFDADDRWFLSDIGKAFIAGQLRHARELCSIFAQWVNSYKRLVPGYEAPTYVAWSRRNRSALVRVPLYHPGKEASTRMELRCPDPACNPYLTFAALLQAGLEGIERGYELPEPMEKNLYHLSPDERRRLGIEQLPETLGEAIELTSESELVLRTLGEHIFNRYIEIKRQEWEDYRVQVTPWELDRYLAILQSSATQFPYEQSVRLRGAHHRRLRRSGADLPAPGLRLDAARPRAHDGRGHLPRLVERRGPVLRGAQRLLLGADHRPVRRRDRAHVPDAAHLGQHGGAAVLRVRGSDRGHLRDPVRGLLERGHRVRVRRCDRRVRRHGALRLRDQARPVELGRHPVRRADRPDRRQRRVHLRRRLDVQPDPRHLRRDHLRRPHGVRHAEDQGDRRQGRRPGRHRAEARDLRRARALPGLHQPRHQPAADLRRQQPLARGLALAREPRRPPYAAPRIDHERGHDHRAHDERVEQDAERDDEAELGQHDQRQDGERAERPGEHDARAGNDRAGDREPAQRALARPVLGRLLADARHQEDVVVDPERHQEDEAQQRQRRIDAGEAEDRVGDEHAEAERRGEAEDHRQHEQQRCEQRAQEHGEDEEHDDQRERDDHVVVARRRPAQVVLLGRRAADERACAPRPPRHAAQLGDLRERLGVIGRAHERDAEPHAGWAFERLAHLADEVAARGQRVRHCRRPSAVGHHDVGWRRRPGGEVAREDRLALHRVDLAAERVAAGKARVEVDQVRGEDREYE